MKHQVIQPKLQARALLNSSSPEENKTLVSSSIAKYSLGESTTASFLLLERTMRSIREHFRRIGHVLDIDQLGSLEEAVKVMVAMADMNAYPIASLSSLDPGIGKTTSYVHFIRNIVKMEEYEDVGILICLPRLEEVSRLFAELELDRELVCIKTSDEAVNALSDAPRQDARVLITTHEQVRRLSKRHDNFADFDTFHFRGQPRQVRIWDEAYAPRSVIHVTSDDISALVSALRSSCPHVAAKLDDLRERLLSTTPGPFDVGEVFGGFSPSVMADVRAVVDERSANETTLQRLMDLEHSTARKANDNTAVAMLFNWTQVIPADFAPVLVFDASGRVRSTYTALEWNGDLCRLSAAPKDYSTVNVHLHNVASSRTAWREQRLELVSHVAGIMTSNPSARYLVIAHKDVGAKQLKPELERAAAGVKFDVLRWGQHQGTNAYADYDHIIVASTFFIPEGAYEALAYASLGLDVSQPLPEGFLAELRQGELADVLLQGACRGAVRGCRDGKAVPCEIHVLASKKWGMKELVPRLFPGCKLKVHAVGKPKMSAAVQRAIDRCKEAIAQSATFISISELMDACGINCRSNFKKQVLNKPAFQAFVKDAGLQAMEGQRAGSIKAYTVPVFPPLDPDEVSCDL